MSSVTPESIFRAAGLIPEGVVPEGRNVPCLLECAECGHVQGITLANVLKGRRCKHPRRPANDPKPEAQAQRAPRTRLEEERKVRAAEEKDALALLRDAGFTPLEPYPGRSRPWSMRCVECGRERRPTLSAVTSGVRCAHQASATTHEEAVAEARAAGFEPLEPYPGSTHVAWQVECKVCGQVRLPQLGGIRAGVRCRHREPALTAEEAVRVARDAGFEPMEAYPQRKSMDWVLKCATCEQVRRTTLSRLMAGQRCAHRRRRQ